MCFGSRLMVSETTWVVLLFLMDGPSNVLLFGVIKECGQNSCNTPCSTTGLLQCTHRFTLMVWSWCTPSASSYYGH